MPVAPDPKFLLAKRRGYKIMELDDAEFRGKAISFASTGMSRKGVAAQLGKSLASLEDWLDRGDANPQREPFGSFARDYLRAERGIEAAIAHTEARRVLSIQHAQSAHEEWMLAYLTGGELKTPLPPAAPSVSDFHWLLRLKESRFPNDYGNSTHRIPERTIDGAVWNEKRGLTIDQLRALVRDPPDEIRAAMIAEADAVFEVLRSEGWAPKQMDERQNQ